MKDILHFLGPMCFEKITSIETRVVKVGDFVIIKEEYILYKGNPFEHVFIFLSINVS